MSETKLHEVEEQALKKAGPDAEFPGVRQSGRFATTPSRSLARAGAGYFEAPEALQSRTPSPSLLEDGRTFRHHTAIDRKSMTHKERPNFYRILKEAGEKIDPATSRFTGPTCKRSTRMESSQNF